MNSRSRALACLLVVLSCAAATDSSARSRAKTRVPPLKASSRTLTPGLFREIASPAGSRSLAPQFARDESGRLVLSWVTRVDSTRTLFAHAWWTGQAWSAPLPIVENARIIANWADVPSLCLVSDSLVAAEWSESAPRGEENSNVRVAVSRDAGRTWSRVVTPHRDREPAEHAFGALAPLPDHRVGVVWLDGRARVSDPERGATALRFTIVDASGSLGSDDVLDPRVCDCCPLTLLSVSTNPVVFYRDRSDDEVRDIHAIGRNMFGQWTARAVHDDGWTITGCPVNGPVVATRLTPVDSGSDSIHVDPVTTFAAAWFTGAHDSARVYVSFKDPRDPAFREPQRVDGGRPSGRPAIAWTSDDGALVVWIEDEQLRVREVARAGGLSPAYTIVRVPPGRAAGIPALAVSGHTLFLAWTDDDPVQHVRLATMEIGR